MAEVVNRSGRELILYGIVFALVWWWCSLTILLPFVLLLKYNAAFQKKWFTFVFTKLLGPRFAPKFIPLRKATFQMLEEKLRRRKKSEHLKILEIGIGSGVNFKYYPENSSLIAVDMNPNFEESFFNNLKNFPEVKVEKIVHSMAEDMSEVKDDSVDVVISTHVLCSVVDVSKVLGEIRRVLKPGGLFLFMEHTAFVDYELGIASQNFINPLWSLYFAGCCLNRKTRISIEQAGFTNVDCRNLEPQNLPFWFKPHVIGVAVK